MNVHNDESARRDLLLNQLDELLRSGGADDVRAFAARHPEMATDILGHAIESLGFAAEDEDAAVDDDAEPAMPSSAGDRTLALDRYWKTRRAVAGDPFSAMDAAESDRVARACRIDRGILRKLVLRMIEEGGIPGRLLASIAAEIGADSAALYAYLVEPAGVSRSDYFAPSGPRPTGKISFSEAVRSSTLTDAQQRFWLERCGG